MNPEGLCLLSDVHLSPDTPDITAAFLRTLKQLQNHPPEALYILGDLFNYWLGDDLCTDFQEHIATALAALPCPVYFQHGNRDFLLGAAFAQRAGLHLLPERYVLTIDGQRVLLEHGDLLCTQDLGYQRLRRVLHHPWTQGLFFRLPKSWRRSIAEYLRRQSQQRGARKDPRQTDVCPEEVARVMQDYGVSVLIHGHTHRPARHQTAQGLRLVLGDWRPSGMMIFCRGGQFCLADPQQES